MILDPMGVGDSRTYAGGVHIRHRLRLLGCHCRVLSVAVSNKSQGAVDAGEEHCMLWETEPIAPPSASYSTLYSSHPEDPVRGYLMLKSSTLNSLKPLELQGPLELGNYFQLAYPHSLISSYDVDLAGGPTDRPAT